MIPDEYLSDCSVGSEISAKFRRKNIFEYSKLIVFKNRSRSIVTIFDSVYLNSDGRDVIVIVVVSVLNVFVEAGKVFVAELRRLAAKERFEIRPKEQDEERDERNEHDDDQDIEHLELSS